MDKTVKEETERMSAEEIRRSHREAKNKSKQLGILADLNVCRRADIERIVSGETEELPPAKPVRHGRGSHLTEQDKQRVVELYLKKLPKNRIAYETGCSMSTVSRIIRKYREGKERNNMVFAEELTAQERERLTTEIESQLKEPLTAEKADRPAPDGMAITGIARGLMSLLTNDLRDFTVGIRATPKKYSLSIVNAVGEELTLTKNREDRQ